MDKKNSKELLENFIVDNQQLEELERKISNFNIFEAIGAVRYELRHSDFLAFIMDPANNHGLADTVTKKILKDVVYNGDHSSGISAVDIDIINADKLEVRREWRNIDILLIDWEQENVIAFENKIDASEGEGQLERYSKELANSFQEFNSLKVYLTPDGGLPNPSADDWIPYSYEHIEAILRKVVKLKESVISEEVLSLLKHYNEILRRHILEDSDIKELCRKIYNEHSDALELIYEHIPDQRLEISNYIQEKVEQDADLLFYDQSKSKVRFSIKEWDQYKSQNKGTNPDKVLLFWFKNRTNGLFFNLIIGPSNEQTVRKELYNTAKNQDFLNYASGFSDTWKQIHKVTVLTEKQLNDLEFEDIRNRIDSFFSQELVEELNKIRPVFEKTFSRLDEKIS